MTAGSNRGPRGREIGFNSRSWEGSNTITANQVTVAEGRTWTFTLSDLLGEGEALLNFNASLQNGSALTINVLGASSASGQVALLTGVNASEWSQVTWTGIDNNLLRWDGNTLYANLGTLVSTDYWVNSGQNALYADGSDAAAEPITRVILNGGTLTMEQNLREGVSLRVDQASTVKLEQGVTLSSGSLSSDNGSTVTLDGAGVYDLGHSTDLKGALASTWTGEVRIGNGGSGSAVTSISELDLGQYGNENSTIVLGRLDGSLKDGMTVEADVRLEGSSEAAVALKNGADGATYTFAGAVTTGSGANFIVDMKREQNFLFTGDVSGWQGLFQSTKDNNAGGSDDYGVTNITFAASENAASADIGTTIRAANGNTVNLTIENATRDVVVTGKVSDKSQWDGESGQYNGTMNVVVDTKGHTTSFRQGLEIDSLTVKSGSEVKVGVAGQEGVTLKANDESGEAVLTNVEVTETSLVRHDAEQQAKVQNVKVWLAGGTQATESGLRLSFTLAPEPTTATLSLLALGLLAGRRRRK